MAYNRFADVYDKLMEHAPYDEWVALTKTIIQQHSLDVQKIVDIGCGTGKITIPLAKLGYDMTGVDVSPHMLSIAAHQANEQNTRVDWVQQDIKQLNGFEKIDLFISYCDVINYITAKTDVLSVFQNVYESLRIDGIFIFDVHSIDYVNDFLINHTFTDVQDDVAYIWNCLPGESAGEMYHELTFFAQHTDQYNRFDEIHHQQVYTKEVYKQLLHKAGFNKIQFFADFNLENQNSEKNNERIFIVAKK